MAQVASIHRDPKKRSQPYKPQEFNPFYEPPQPQLLTPDIFDEIFKD